MAVEVGQDAPDFELESDSGERVRLSSLRGSPVVLYFYPKDDTPGCTLQACEIRDAWSDFEATRRRCARREPRLSLVARTVPLEVRPALHAARRPGARSGGPYGVWVEQTYGDKTWIGNERSTFVIDSDGKVASVLRQVKPAEHADDVLKALA